MTRSVLLITENFIFICLNELLNINDKCLIKICNINICLKKRITTIISDFKEAIKIVFNFFISSFKKFN